MEVCFLFPLECVSVLKRLKEIILSSKMTSESHDQMNPTHPQHLDCEECKLIEKIPHPCDTCRKVREKQVEVKMKNISQKNVTRDSRVRASKFENRWPTSSSVSRTLVLGASLEVK